MLIVTVIHRTKTVEELERHWTDIDDKAAKVAATLRPLNVHKVIFDITALGAKVAHLLGLPSIAISNFTFDWIYEAERTRVPALSKFIDLMVAAYRTTSLWLALPFTAVRAHLSSFFFFPNWRNSEYILTMLVCKCIPLIGSLLMYAPIDGSALI
jgi:hypothetical protein